MTGCPADPRPDLDADLATAQNEWLTPRQRLHAALRYAERLEAELARLREERDSWERTARNYESISANAGLL